MAGAPASARAEGAVVEAVIAVDCVPAGDPSTVAEGEGTPLVANGVAGFDSAGYGGAPLLPQAQSVASTMKNGIRIGVCYPELTAPANRGDALND